MKNKLLGVKILSIFISFALLLFLTPGCGDGGGSGDGGGAKSLSSKTSSGKKPVASYVATVDPQKGTITFEYQDSNAPSKSGKKSFRKLYTSQPPGSGKNVTLASSGMSWNGTTKILSGNVTITNNTVPNGGTNEPLYGTYATIKGISPAVANVVNEYGYDPDGYPYFNHAPNGESIAVGATGSAVSWQFNDLDAVNFNFYGNIYADNWTQIAGDGINGVGGSTSTAR